MRRGKGGLANMTSGYSIAICEYAFNPAFLESTLFYGGGGGTRRAPFAFGVLRSHDHFCLVDTGVGDTRYQRALATKQGLEGVTSAQDRLAQMGWSADDVTDVFVTHAHYDHFGNIDAFPNARFYVQRREISDWLWALSLPPRMRYFNESVDPATLQDCVRLAAEGRLTLLDGDVPEILPGLGVHAAYDTHTFGSMWLTVEGADGAGRYVLVGDNVYNYESLEAAVGGGAFVPIGHATGSNLRQVMCLAEILDAAGGEVERVLPFHEARVADVFESERNSQGLATVDVCR